MLIERKKKGGQNFSNKIYCLISSDKKSKNQKHSSYFEKFLPFIGQVFYFLKKLYKILLL